MSQTATTMLDILKDAWTSQRLAKQFESENAPVNRLERVPATMIGAQAQVPIHKSRNLAGYTSVGAAGGSLNAAGTQGVDQATYTLVYHWLQISLDTSALMQSNSNATAILSGKDLEIENAVENVRHQAGRQLVTNGDGIVAQCATGGASTTVSLRASPSGSYYGYDAMVRGWLGVGSFIDIGSTANTDSIVAGATVSAIDDTSTAPTITIDSSVSTTAGTDYVYIANPNSGTAANTEMNGLRNLVNTSGAVGGLNPATAGEEFWKAAKRDTSTTTLSLDLALSLQREVMQRSGKPQTNVWTSLKQRDNFYSLLQNQVRFPGEMQMRAGGSGAVQWNGMDVEAFPDILDSDWYCLTLSDFVRVSAGSNQGPVWATDLSGQGGSTQWSSGTTQFTNGIVYPLQIGLQRRNTHAAATGLTA